LIHLDNLPSRLRKLICSYNNITSLDNLPENLEYLDCTRCELTELSNLPIGLKELVCGNELLTNLDFLPESVNYLTINKANLNLFKLELENLPQSINVLVYNKTIAPKLYINEDIWNIPKNDKLNRYSYYNTLCKLEKNKNAQLEPNTFCAYSSNFNDTCKECNEHCANCKCGIDYYYDSDNYYD
jgi:hypothetical protein